MEKQQPSETETIPTKEMVEFAERKAGELRQRISASPTEPLNPLTVAKILGVDVLQPSDFEGLPDTILQPIKSMGAKAFSGGAMETPEGGLLVILNPNQTLERANVTLMEEIFHKLLGHTPSQIGIGRTFDKRQENEAYWTAAASLLPKACIGKAVYKGESAADIALRFGVSVELAEFRIKILNLWAHYQQRRATIVNENGRK